MAKKLIPIILILLSVIAIWRLLNLEPEPVAQAIADTPKPKPTATVTITPVDTPTVVDHSSTAVSALTHAAHANATAQSALNISLEMTHAIDRMNHEEAMKVYALEETQVANASRKVSITETMMVFNMTAQPIEAQIRQDILALEVARITQTYVAPMQERTLLLNNYQDEFSVASIIFEILGGLSILAAMVAMIVVFVYKNNKLEVAKMNAQLQSLQQAAVKKENAPGQYPLPVGLFVYGIRMEKFDALLPREKMREIAKGVLIYGKPFSYENFTPLEKCVSRVTFQKLQELFEDFDLAHWKEDSHSTGMLLSPKGEAFLGEFLWENWVVKPPPHLSETSIPA